MKNAEILTWIDTGIGMQRYPIWQTVAEALEVAAALEPGSSSGIAGYIAELDAYWHFWPATGLWSWGAMETPFPGEREVLSFPPATYGQPLRG